MRNAGMATAVLGIAASLLSGSAHADPAPVAWQPCGWAWTTIPRTYGFRIGEMHAGPIVVVDAVTGELLPATVTCSIQEYPNLSHDDPDVVSITSPAALPGVAVLPPTPFSIQSRTADDDFATCTRLDVAGRAPLYLDESDGGYDPFWTTDPAAGCYYHTWIGPEGPRWGRDFVKPLACDVLAVVFPPDGDGAGVFDCP